MITLDILDYKRLNCYNVNGVLLYVKNKLEQDKINSVLGYRSLVGYSPLVLSFDDTPENMDRLGQQLSWRSADSWAFYYKGQRIASGDSLPTAADLQNAFASANVPNRVVFLRNFLAANPTNLDARRELMKELHRYAYQKTSKELNITPRDPRVDPTVMSGSTIAPEMTRELSPEADLNIWGDLAALIDRAFSTGDWLAVLPSYFSVSYPENMTLHSPSMKAIYKRNLSRVENALENRQTDLMLWKMWQTMAQTTGRRLADFYPQSLLQNLKHITQQGQCWGIQGVPLLPKCLFRG